MSNKLLGSQRWWLASAEGTLECRLCAHGCRLRHGQRGLCNVRQRRDDKIESLVYGRIVAEHVDPIEKKPIFHVMPGSLSYSIATHGCNFRCLHCQNAGISQVPLDMKVELTGVFRKPDEIIESALAGGCRSISYTYVEPTVFYEYAYDCCLAAFAKGLKNIFVSNGYMTKEIIAELAPVLSAINIDLKSFSDEFYKKICGARLQPVLDNIVRCREAGIWVEVTTLLIPGMNDANQQLAEIASFLAAIDKSIPWHVSGYHPAYKMTVPPPTPQSTLLRARKIGRDQGLHHVYTGNRLGSEGEDTSCPNCGLLLVARQGFRIKVNRIKGGCCPVCNQTIAGIW